MSTDNFERFWDVNFDCPAAVLPHLRQGQAAVTIFVKGNGYPFLKLLAAIGLRPANGEQVLAQAVRGVTGVNHIKRRSRTPRCGPLGGAVGETAAKHIDRTVSVRRLAFHTDFRRTELAEGGWLRLSPYAVLRRR